MKEYDINKPFWRMKQGDFSKAVVVGIFALVILFTVAVLYIVFTGGTEPSTLTACFFAWATGELGWTAWIKRKKIEGGDGHG